MNAPHAPVEKNKPSADPNLFYRRSAIQAARSRIMFSSVSVDTPLGYKLLAAASIFTILSILCSAFVFSYTPSVSGSGILSVKDGEYIATATFGGSVLGAPLPLGVTVRKGDVLAYIKAPKFYTPSETQDIVTILNSRENDYKAKSKLQLNEKQTNLILSHEIFTTDRETRELDAAKASTLKHAADSLYPERAASIIESIDSKKKFPGADRFLTATELNSNESAHKNSGINSEVKHLIPSLAKNGTHLSDLRHQFESEASDILAHENTVIQSEIDGFISYLDIKPGMHVSNNSVIAIVTPNDYSLEGEMQIPAINGALIEKGQKVAIKLDAFPYLKYGTLYGHVTSISWHETPTKTRDKTNITPFYSVKFAFPQKEILVDGTHVPFRSGFTFKADIYLKRAKLYNWFFRN